ncbi:MAG TPA: hypothetical protein VK509_04095, partial [Polyangiales bacterium]|nr:hypothetical protein [Polyangiales bacterium]
IDPADLPSSMAEALKARVDALSAGARELACAAALSLGVRLGLDDCLVLLPQRTGAVRAVLDELCASQVLRMEGDAYVLAQQGWLPVLRATLTPEQSRDLHLRLAQLYERRGDQGFRLAQHLLYAGDTERALDVLIADAKASQAITDHDAEAFVRLLGSLPSNWSETYTRAIELCRELGRPRRELLILLIRFSGLIPRDNVKFSGQVLALMEQLYRDSGLELYHTLEPSLPQAARLQQTFEQTQRRHAESSGHERGLEALQAIGGLAQTLVSAMGLVAAGHDHAFWAQLPSVGAYEPLSPALAMLEQLRHGLGARMTARGDRAREIYGGLLARMAQPDRGGLDESHHRYTNSAVMFALGIIEASMGIASALDWAEQLEREPTVEVDAVLVRMVYHLWQGNAREAERCKRRVEVLRVQNAPRQMPEGTHLLAEVAAHAATTDLMRVKQSMDEIERLAKRLPGWVPIHQYAAGEYQRLRGDAASALGHFEQGLACSEAGRHQAWPDLAGAHVRALLDLGRDEEACSLGERYLAAAEQAELGHVGNYIRMPLALAQARLGLHEVAARNAEASVRDFEQRGSGGLSLGVAYETWARVASLARNEPLFARCAERCAELYRAGENRALSARYARLIQDAKQAELGISAGLTAAADFTGQTLGESVAHVTSIMESCVNARDRARCALQLLMQHSGAHAGWLYGGQDGVIVELAQLGPEAMPANVDQLARGFLLAQAETDGDTQDGTDMQTTPGPTAEWQGARGERYRPVLLAHPTGEGLAVLALAILLVEPGVEFHYPADVAAEVSRLVHEHDASTVFALVG